MAVDIVRAWKDPEYQKSLTREELATLPPNPAGPTELTEEALAKVAGGLPCVFTKCWTINFPCSL